jgi:hypothetical protein
MNKIFPHKYSLQVILFLQMKEFVKEGKTVDSVILQPW